MPAAVIHASWLTSKITWLTITLSPETFLLHRQKLLSSMGRAWHQHSRMLASRAEPHSLLSLPLEGLPSLSHSLSHTLSLTLTQIQELFDRMIQDARSGFRVAMAMDVVLFTLGILMLGAAAGMAIASNTFNSSWVSVGVTGGSGALVTCYSLFIAQPRKQVKVGAFFSAVELPHCCIW